MIVIYENYRNIITNAIKTNKFNLKNPDIYF